MIVYGPYKKKDGRKFVIEKDCFSKVYVSYPRYLVERYINKKLNKDDIVHHIDGNIDNNFISNLCIMGRGKHSSIHSLIPETIDVNCVTCNKVIKKTFGHLNRLYIERKAGPFCGKSCLGIYSSSVQNYKIKKFVIGNPFYLRNVYFDRCDRVVCNIYYDKDVDLCVLFEDDFWERKCKNIELIKNKNKNKNKQKDKLICIYCNKKFKCKNKQKFCSTECCQIFRRKVDRPNKDDLLELVWSIPTNHIAKKLGVSGKAIEKWCKQYGINKPSRGYWSKINKQ